MELKIYESQLTKRLRPYNFDLRQLHVAYFATLVILHHPRNTDGPLSRVAIVASSFIAGLFREFLIRDDVRYLGPIFTFYLLAASMTQLRCYQYHGLRKSAHKNLQTIAKAQEELEKKWPSASGSRRQYTKVRDWICNQEPINGLPEGGIEYTSHFLFEDYGEDLCNQWDLLTWSLDGNDGSNQATTAEDDLENLRVSSIMDSSASLEVPLNTLVDTSQEFPGTQPGYDQYQTIADSDIGNWLVWDDIGL